jgi:6-phosphogluconate dehydrogenase
MLPGSVVDETINTLLPLISEGDLIIDGGNCL